VSNAKFNSETASKVFKTSDEGIFRYYRACRRDCRGYRGRLPRQPKLSKQLWDFLVSGD